LRRCEAELRSCGVVRAGVFGSVARGTATPQSDVDVLVEFGRPRDVMDLGEVHYVLEQAFGEPVDVLEPTQLAKLAGNEELKRVQHAF